MDTQNLETCKYIELNGVQLCCFTNGNIYRVLANGDMKHYKGTKRKDNYIQIGINQKRYLLHRVMGYAFLDLDINNIKIEIDHINRIKYDNRLDNLRVVTHQHNNWNKDTKGWTLLNNGKYRARIQTPERKQIYLGYFDNEIDAHNAYLKAKEEYHIFN